MIKLYQNREWLYNKYWEEKLSLHQIAKLCNVSDQTILKYMNKFKISRRSMNEARHLVSANHCNLSQNKIDLINGELLGDGHLGVQSSYSSFFSYGSKYFEYITYISNILKSFGIRQVGRIRMHINKKRGNISYHYVSRSYVELLSIRKKWYPDGKKIVPKDLKLTPLTCRQWYIGDGCLIHNNCKNLYIKLFTESLKIIDVDFLVNGLIKLGFKATRQPFKNTIYISTHSTKDFLNYIGKCPVKCYEYKWAY